MTYRRLNHIDCMIKSDTCEINRSSLISILPLENILGLIKTENLFQSHVDL